MEGVDGDTRSRSGQEAGRVAEGMAKPRDRDGQIFGCPGGARQVLLLTYADAKREGTPFHTPTLHQPCSHPFLGRWGQPRCQVAGQGTTRPIWDLPAFSAPAPGPPTCHPWK